MGTPDFAVFSLQALLESDDEIVGAVTQPDQPKGRGYVMTPPPVKKFALENGIPVYQPEKLRTQEFTDLLFELNPDLIVVTAYGKILPPSVLDFPPLGCINVHGSLLPEYRGAAPMQRAIMDGKKVTGITTMMMDAGLDTGDILLQGKVEITDEDNFETLHDKMGVCGGKVLLDTIKELKSGTLTRIKQDDGKSNYAKKIEKCDCKIDFCRSAEEIHNQIRGLSPVPLAFTHTGAGKLLKITSAKVSDLAKPDNAEAGDILATKDGKITVACGAGTLDILGVLPEGKGRMTAEAYINGRGIQAGDRLGNRSGDAI